MNREMKNAIADAYKIARQIGRDDITQALHKIGRAADRTEYRRLNDQQSDQDRRRLVGARVPVYDADRYKALADAMNLSLYRFVYDALEHYRAKMEASMGLEYDGRRYFDPNQTTLETSQEPDGLT